MGLGPGGAHGAHGAPWVQGAHGAQWAHGAHGAHAVPWGPRRRPAGRRRREGGRTAENTLKFKTTLNYER